MSASLFILLWLITGAASYMGGIHYFERRPVTSADTGGTIVAAFFGVLVLLLALATAIDELLARGGR